MGEFLPPAAEIPGEVSPVGLAEEAEGQGVDAGVRVGQEETHGGKDEHPGGTEHFNGEAKLKPQPARSKQNGAKKREGFTLLTLCLVFTNTNLHRGSLHKTVEMLNHLWSTDRCGRRLCPLYRGHKSQGTE